MRERERKKRERKRKRERESNESLTEALSYESLNARG
jgi:hypothetical protein